MLTSLPDRAAAKLRAGLRNTQATSVAARWIEHGPHDVLVLQGDTGAGKSLAAAWCFTFVRHREFTGFREGVAPRRDCVWADARVVATLKPWDERWRTFDSAPLVVLDDVGTEDSAGAMTSVLERLFNLAGGRAVITTNLAPGPFAERYGDRVASRFAGGALWVATTDVDMRLDAPDGPELPQPNAPTERERAARDAQREAEQREDAAHQQWLEENAGSLDRYRSELRRLTGEQRDRKRRLTVAQTFPEGPSAEEQAIVEARRQELRAQVEKLQREGGGST